MIAWDSAVGWLAGLGEVLDGGCREAGALSLRGVLADVLGRRNRPTGTLERAERPALQTVLAAGQNAHQRCRAEYVERAA